MNDRTDLGRAIAYLRDRRSQAEMAELAGIDRTTWSHYETGKRKPRQRNLEKVLQALGCSRLELEETVWRLRRRRLLYEERLRKQQEGGSRGTTPASSLGLQPSLRVPPTLVRRDVQEMLARLSETLEEILVYALTLDR